ncbi:transcriptional regulator [Clostridia bacterium]|nr:transcriptional regulator [Clostridia bacterium]
MYEDFTRERIARLRIQKGDSARDMSLSLGQNDAYINKIENKKSLPSLTGLFYICEYLKISPKEFFDEGNENPAILNELIEELKPLDSETLAHILALVRQKRDKS